MSPGYRIEWRWILVGPLLGFFSGLVSAAMLAGVPVLLLVGPLAPCFAIVAGVFAGAPIGAAVGLVAGLPFALLVGQHLPLQTAVLRASILGAVVPPLVLLGAVSWLPAAWWLCFDVEENVTWLGEWPYLAAAVLGGITAACTARIDMPRTDVS